MWTVAGALGGDVETVVTTEPVPAAAIVRVARQRQTDLVVVGRHCSTLSSSNHGHGVAEAVVERAERSVLVLPVDGA